eukprot:2994764-Pleurochrysis_carterae.AAC.2
MIRDGACKYNTFYRLLVAPPSSILECEILPESDDNAVSDKMATQISPLDGERVSAASRSFRQECQKAPIAVVTRESESSASSPKARRSDSTASLQ